MFNRTLDKMSSDHYTDLSIMVFMPMLGGAILYPDKLLFLAALLFLGGAILVCRSFVAKTKSVLGGVLGVIALLCSGNIVIYLYSQLPVPQRVIEEFHPEELPDLVVIIKEESKFMTINKRSVELE